MFRNTRQQGGGGYLLEIGRQLQAHDYCKGREGLEIEPEALQELLLPVRDRLLQFISHLDDFNATVALSERQELAVASFGALSLMTSFREDPKVVELLMQRIETLTPGSANGERRIAREALKMATTLRAPVARAVDDALERFRPARGQETDTGELRRLIAAARAIGCTSRTVDLLGSIAREVAELQEAVLETLVSMGQTLPPVAVLALAVPAVGFGELPALIALTLP